MDAVSTAPRCWGHTGSPCAWAQECLSWARALVREPQPWAPDLGPGRDPQGTGGGLFREAPGLSHLIPSVAVLLLPHPPSSSPGSLLPLSFLSLLMPVPPFPVSPSRALVAGRSQLPATLRLAEPVVHRRCQGWGQGPHCSFLPPLPHVSVALESLECTEPCARWSGGTEGEGVAPAFRMHQGSASSTRKPSVLQAGLGAGEWGWE